MVRLREAMGNVFGSASPVTATPQIVGDEHCNIARTVQRIQGSPALADVVTGNLAG
jgi:hypothetical protein